MYLLGHSLVLHCMRESCKWLIGDKVVLELDLTHLDWWYHLIHTCNALCCQLFILENGGRSAHENVKEHGSSQLGRASVTSGVESNARHLLLLLFIWNCQGRSQLDEVNWLISKTLLVFIKYPSILGNFLLNYWFRILIQCLVRPVQQERVYIKLILLTKAGMVTSDRLLGKVKVDGNPTQCHSIPLEW